MVEEMQRLRKVRRMPGRPAPRARSLVWLLVAVLLGPGCTAGPLALFLASALNKGEHTSMTLPTPPAAGYHWHCGRL